MSVQTKLLNIQTSLKAPKNQYNQFGRYKYRSCEDILEALKPLLLKERATITIKDDIVELNGKNYIKIGGVRWFTNLKTAYKQPPFRHAGNLLYHRRIPKI